MSLITWIDAAAGVATAAGVAFAAAQLWQADRQSTAAFEQTFVERYIDVTSRIPLELLLGSVAYSPADLKSRRAFYDYFELCEEEAFYAKAGRINSRTWDDWREAIRANLSKQGFAEAWADISAAAPGQFQLLRDELHGGSSSSGSRPVGQPLEVAERCTTATDYGTTGVFDGGSSNPRRAQ